VFSARQAPDGVENLLQAVLTGHLVGDLLGVVRHVVHGHLAQRAQEPSRPPVLGPGEVRGHGV
jgi:hypothetical protein